MYVKKYAWIYVFCETEDFAMLTKVLPTIQEEFKSRGNGFKQGESLSASERENEDEIGGISIYSVVIVNCWLVGLRCVNTFGFILVPMLHQDKINLISKKCPKYIFSCFWVNTCTHAPG